MKLYVTILTHNRLAAKRLIEIMKTITLWNMVMKRNSYTLLGM